MWILHLLCCDCAFAARGGMETAVAVLYSSFLQHLFQEPLLCPPRRAFCGASASLELSSERAHCDFCFPSWSLFGAAALLREQRRCLTELHTAAQVFFQSVSLMMSHL